VRIIKLDVQMSEMADTQAATSKMKIELPSLIISAPE